MQKASSWRVGRKMAAALLATGLALSCTSVWAAETPKRGGAISVGLNTDVTSLDPHTTVAVVDAIVLNHIFEPLIAYGEKLEILPVACQSWDASRDYKTYTFRLIPGKPFHNGREMTAEDVKYSLERIMDPATKSPRQSLFKDVERVEVKDKHTVAVHLREKSVSFPHVLATLNPIMAIVPKDEVEKQGGVLKHPVGTGPYKFVEWKPDRHVLLERFAQYKGQSGPSNGLGGAREAYLDQIKLVPLPEESVSIMALLNKEIDLLQYFPPKYVEKFHKEYQAKGLALDEVTGLSWYQIYFGVDKPVTSNPKFRLACAYAIDIDLVTQAAYLGHAKSNPSAIARGNTYRTDYHDTWYKKDAAKAKALLREAGYNGEEVVLDTTKKYPAMYRQAVAVQAELQAVGVNVKLNVIEWPVLLKKCTDGDFQMLSYGGGATPDPAIAYGYLRRNKFEQTHPRMQEISQAALETADLDKLRKLFEEAHRITYEHVPWIHLYNYNFLQAHWKYVKGYRTINTGYPRLWGVWLDK